MTAGGPRVVALLCCGVVLAAPAAYAQPTAPRLEGLRLAEALQALEARGLRLIYSSETVRAEMRVRTEPRGRSPRSVLEELLWPHGLTARDGPAASILIVKDPRARLRRPAPARATDAPTGAGPTPPHDEAAPARFEETVVVNDFDPSTALVGAPPRALHPTELRAAAGGFGDALRTLQAQPGVVATQELDTRLAVRGGGPDQNLTIVDGIEMVSLHRLRVAGEDLGLPQLGSLVNPETVARVELVPGAFDVRYGDRLSSVVVVTNRDGSDVEAVQGLASLGLTDANVVVEGKLARRAGGSWLVAARRTVFDVVAEPVVNGRLPTFQDVQARVSWPLGPGRRLTFIGLGSAERTRPTAAEAADERLTTSATNGLGAVTFESGVGQRTAVRTAASVTRFDDVVAASERSFDNSRGANTPASIVAGELFAFDVRRHVTVHDVAVRQELVFKPSPRHFMDLGVDLHRLDTRWAWNVSGDRSQHQAIGSSVRLGGTLPAQLDSSVDSYRVGGWLQDRWQVTPRVVIQPGVRVDRSGLAQRATLSPRLAVALDVEPVRIDGSVRVHTQAPGYEKMTHADYFVDLSNARASKLRAERSLQATLGVERPVGRDWRLRTDVYYKQLSHLLVGRLETEEARLARLATYDVPAELRAYVPGGAQVTVAPVNGGAGRAHGVDVSLIHVGRGPGGPLTGWLAYSYGRATRTAYGVTAPFDYDRRHAVSLATTVQLGPRVDVSTTFRWATGLPRTAVTGVRLALEKDASDRDGDGNRGEWLPQRNAAGFPVFQPDLGDIANVNRARLPAFARLDARITYRPAWGGERWGFYLDVLNALNRTNIVQVDAALELDPQADRPRIVERYEDRGIPFFPSVGVRFWF